MKKIFWTIFCIVLFCLLFCACNKTSDPDDSTANPPSGSSVGSSETTGEFNPNLPDLTFNGADFTVLHYDATFERYLFTANMEDTAEVINEAVWRRNNEVEEKYDVKIKEYAGASNQVMRELTASVFAGDGIYDVIVPQSSEGYSSMITSNLVCNLNAVPHLDLSRQWWYPDALDNMNIAGRVYFASSYYTVACQNFFNLIFNKDMIVDLNLDSPTPSVFDGTWTIDKMMAMMKHATADIDGNGVMSEDDRFGFVTCTNIMYPFMSGFGQVSVGKDSEDKPVLTLNNERTANIVDKMNTLMSGNDVYFGTYSNMEYILKTFGGKHALFALFGLGTYYQTLRSIEEFDYGLLPLPKFDENQAQYYTLRADSFVGVPSIVKDIDKTGIILEALSAASMEYLYPAFKDKVLYAKCLRDEESSKVLDILYDSFIYDIGMTYCNNRALARLLDQYKDTKEIDFASYYAKNSPVIQNELDNLFAYITTDGVEGATSIEPEKKTELTA